MVAVVCTHGHNDHVTVAPELGEALDAPVLLHPADDVLWRMTHPDEDFRTVEDGLVLTSAGSNCARCTPLATRRVRSAGTPPTSVRCSAATPCSAAAPARRAGPTPTSPPSWSRSPDGSASCPATTVVYTGHGDTTTVGDEIVHYDDWVATRQLSSSRTRLLLRLVLVLGQRTRITQRGKRLELLDADALSLGRGWTARRRGGTVSARRQPDPWPAASGLARLADLR